MSFVAFHANNPSVPPAPFAPVRAGDLAFYLVAIATTNGTLPAPTAQLSVSTRTEKGQGRNPVDVVRETASAWQGRRRVTIATRVYRWERFTKGAKAAARDAALWTGVDGGVMVLWSHLVSVADAERLGYRTPSATTAARAGRRGVGVENNAAASVAQGPRGGARVVALSAEQERDNATRAREYAAQERARSVAPAPVAPAAPVRVAPAQAAPVGPDAGAARFAALDLSDAAPTRPVDSGPDAGASRFAALDLD
ncbi:MAG: hypothetical protein AB7L09_01830 [Nitrospira sp.]